MDQKYTSSEREAYRMLKWMQMIKYAIKFKSYKEMLSTHQRFGYIASRTHVLVKFLVWGVPLPILGCHTLKSALHETNNSMKVIINTKLNQGPPSPSEIILWKLYWCFRAAPKLRVNHMTHKTKGFGWGIRTPTGENL